MTVPLAGKKALVVGATGDIGRELSLRLAALGALLTVQAGHESAGLQDLCLRTGADSLILDLDNQMNWAKLLTKTAGIDLLCVVRGPFLQKPLHLTAMEEWSASVSANLILPGALVSAVLPGMVRRKWGRILLFGGTRTETIRGFRTNAVYAAAKTGLSSLVRSVALDYASSGITCNLICPGLVENSALDEQARLELAKKNPDGKLVSVQEIVETAVFLLLNGSANGVLLPVDKGWAPVLI